MEKALRVIRCGYRQWPNCAACVSMPLAKEEAIDDRMQW
jgi:hypothetical protein